MLNGIVDRLRLPPDVSTDSKSRLFETLIMIIEISRRGIKQPSTVFMLCSVFILYASTVTDFAVKTTYVVEYDRLLNTAVAALEATSSSSINAALDQFGQRARTISYVIGALYTINVRSKLLVLILQY